MIGNYNLVAPFYDRLSKLVYGDAIVNAKQFLVNSIHANSTILIIGGGTGRILEEMTKRHPSGLRITYVEISEKMMFLSAKRNIGDNIVTFLQQPIEHLETEQKFDIVITPFVLDNFAADTLRLVFNKIHPSLLPGGLWLFADFRENDDSKLWQKVMLKAMYLFFRTVCNIEADRLPDTASLFANNMYKPITSKTFFLNFIEAIVYRKPF